ncbi:MAG TPA: type II toxin-antitoxin system RelE/ParE family toxin, partial [Bdellovibrionota bacterium]|nr:type II toxin-antitoxin system RelE/ParE family toxin [Bdellovibrionota bacterium]
MRERFVRSTPRGVLVYEQPSGRRPFETWFFGIQDQVTAGRVLTRLSRVEQGNLGDVKNLGEGLHEMRLAFGVGYRIYFAFVGETMIVLLSGGDKGSQNRDIQQARSFL